MEKQFYIISILLLSLKGYTQFEKDIFSFDYTLTPINNDEVDFYKTEAKLVLPIKLKKGILLNSVGLNYYQFNYNNVNINTKDLDEFYRINYRLTYTYPISNKWNISTRGGLSIASNLKDHITSNDLLFNGGIAMMRKGSTSQLMFGLVYSTFTGKPKVHPLISYAKEVNENISYRLGFPSTFIKYKFNDQHSLKTSLGINGFYANLSSPISIDINNIANNASFTTGSLGLEYNYWMSDFWAITFKGGYILYNKYELRDNTDNIVHEFDANSKPYFSTGLRFNLINKSKIKKRNDKQ